MSIGLFAPPFGIGFYAACAIGRVAPRRARLALSCRADTGSDLNCRGTVVLDCTAVDKSSKTIPEGQKSMSLLGKAAVAMWWNISPEHRAEFGDWHSHEHFPERMSIPGFRRGSRWSSTENTRAFFVLYELEQYDVLTSSGYLARLNAPTWWSTRMMPQHLNMVRSQCRLAASFGGGIATSLATIRLSPATGREGNLKAVLADTMGGLVDKPGLTGAHLLLTDTPETSVPTTEQQIRGMDGTADWIVLLSGYDPDRIEDVLADSLSPSSLHAAGAQAYPTVGRYQLAFAMTPQDVAARGER
jgi:hypothetical protein